MVKAAEATTSLSGSWTGSANNNLSDSDHSAGTKPETKELVNFCTAPSFFLMVNIPSKSLLPPMPCRIVADSYAV